jgi:hypothetical protein
MVFHCSYPYFTREGIGQVYWPYLPFLKHAFGEVEVKIKGGTSFSQNKPLPQEKQEIFKMQLTLKSRNS